MTEIRKIRIDQLEFDCRVCGDEENELVILLHGFPESSIMYRDLMKDLNSHNYYCIAPNMRGYSKKARPRGKKNYTIDKLVGDILDIAKHIGKDKFHLIGHDWGAAIGWQLVHDYPNKILSWTGMSVPHLQSFFNAVLKDKDQKEKSKYIALFQFPFLPEWNIRLKDFKILRNLLDVQRDEEIEDYIAIAKENGALTAMLNYYRANNNLAKRAGTEQILGSIGVPTLFIWGKKDIAIGSVAVDNAQQYMKGEYRFLELDAGHWLIQTNYSEIKLAIIDHLSKFRIAPGKAVARR
jgi:pimeloyl-ACP methyl ester carboxylesterase